MGLRFREAQFGISQPGTVLLSTMPLPRYTFRPPETSCTTLLGAGTHGFSHASPSHVRRFHVVVSQPHRLGRSVAAQVNSSLRNAIHQGIQGLLHLSWA